MDCMMLLMTSFGAENMLISFMVMYVLGAVFDGYLIKAVVLKVWAALPWRDTTS
jgi:hypothetical protein